jgi:hypothetical protein
MHWYLCFYPDGTSSSRQPRRTRTSTTHIPDRCWKDTKDDPPFTQTNSRTWEICYRRVRLHGDTDYLQNSTINSKSILVSGMRRLVRNPPEPSTTQGQPLRGYRNTVCFCPECWRFQDFRRNKDDVRDWTFMKETISRVKNRPTSLLQRVEGPRHGLGHAESLGLLFKI